MNLKVLKNHHFLNGGFFLDSLSRPEIAIHKKQSLWKKELEILEIIAIIAAIPDKKGIPFRNKN